MHSLLFAFECQVRSEWDCTIWTREMIRCIASCQLCAAHSRTKSVTTENLCREENPYDDVNYALALSLAPRTPQCSLSIFTTSFYLRVPFLDGTLKCWIVSHKNLPNAFEQPKSNFFAFCHRFLHDRKLKPLAIRHWVQYVHDFSSIEKYFSVKKTKQINKKKNLSRKTQESHSK